MIMYAKKSNEDEKSYKREMHFLWRKKRVSVQIEGRSYSLITTDDEKYVQKVANEVLSHIRKAAQSTKQLDTRDCAVLAALNFCDDRNKALKKNKDYVEKADKIIQQTNDLNRLCKEYREKAYGGHER